MQSKKYENPKIALLNIELELKSERANAEVRVDNTKDYQAIVDAEWKILYDKMEICHKAGVNIVLSKLPIGDVATQYFADRNMFCAGRVTDEDMMRTQSACGGAILTSISNGIKEIQMGKCALFEEKQVGSERFNFFTGCSDAHSATIIMRGGTEQFIDESVRSMHDSIMVVCRTSEFETIVAGGGATEMHLSSQVRETANTVSDKTQLIMLAWAKALEIIPRQLIINSGFEPSYILNKLRYKHNTDKKDGKYFGVDVKNGMIANNYDAFVWEPSLIKENVISAATEVACMILSVDQTIRHPKSQSA
ncbi:T-complex protein 1 subunit eta [Intoshia linei]|uniref:CCT-eta n=1 Tax=Intoshia linei TaxID=1819745 RepID=A0A177AVF7_9BILA|nr:T-complex protein 1 subunit eta [Intoshia linei]